MKAGKDPGPMAHHQGPSGGLEGPSDRRSPHLELRGDPQLGHSRKPQAAELTGPNTLVRTLATPPTGEGGK